MIVEEIVGAITLVYLGVLGYKAMENYESFVAEYGNLADKFTYISICFCLIQILVLILFVIYRLGRRSRKLIKKR